MTDKKWKEFWIAKGITANGDDHVWESKPNFEIFGNGLGVMKPVIHSIQIEAYQDLQKKLEIAREALELIHKDLDAYFISPTAVRLIAEAEKALKELEEIK